MENKGFYRKIIKRILDLFFAILSLIVLSPLLLITTLLVRFKLGRPVIFKQARPGLKEKIFFLYKFRSMTNEIDADGRLLPDAKRLTKFGKFLRMSSIDELLELVNIIKGDMSFVGPRPLSIYYLPHYPSKFRRRHDVRPGLTGLAQVNGRNNLPWDDRFEMDINYVDNISFGLDFKIFLNTLYKVIKHSDVVVRDTEKVKDYGPYCILKEEKAGGKKLTNMTYSEIGSYFHLSDRDVQFDDTSVGDFNWLPIVGDSCFTFSGRNAIHIALTDILKNRKIHQVFAPSYCCVSMLQSFIDYGIKIKFYAVDYSDGKFLFQEPKVDKHTVVLIMSYFGLDVRACHNMISSIHKSGAVIIEDITHSLFSNKPTSEYSDYYITSLRKWFAIPTGGWVGKKSGVLLEKTYIDSNNAVKEKISAMREKYDYLIGKVESKERYLLAQAKFDNDLIHVDRMLKIDDTSFSILARSNVDEMINQRRKNIKVLISGLRELDDNLITIPIVNLRIDTPIFLPIFLKTEDRDSLRKYLICKGIYCPIHWPEIMGTSESIKKNELSLICDQRYSERDMKAIVEVIKEWSCKRKY